MLRLLKGMKWGVGGGMFVMGRDDGYSQQMGVSLVGMI